MSPAEPKAPSTFDRTWLAIDGSTDQELVSNSDPYVLPDELARLVIERFSKPGDVVLDPYAGQGEIVLGAQALGRTAIGIEQDVIRVRALAPRLDAPSKMIQGELKTGSDSNVPRVDLAFTSPAPSVFGGWDDEMGYVNYWSEFDRMFERVSSVLKPNGTLVLEVSNLHEASSIRPLAFEAVVRLSRVYLFVAEYVRVNTGPKLAAPRLNHSHLFVFRNTRTTKRRIEDVIAEDYF